MKNLLDNRYLPMRETPEIGASDERARKRYAPPMLEIYGDLRELTRSQPTGTAFDAAFGRSTPGT